MSTAPRACIAVVELTGGDNLRRVLAHLQQAGPETTILVACRGRAGRLAEMAGVQVIENAGQTVPARRLAALRAAQADWVVLLEDTTLPTANWFAALPGLLADPEAGALWGPVHVAPDLPARFRALGIMEYGRFSTGAPGAEMLPGNCMILRRDAALEAPGPGATGLVEHVLAPRLAATGHPVRFDAALTSSYALQDSHGARLATRFSHGRLYAANRYPRERRAAHLKAAARAVLVPAVLSLRGARHLAAQSSPSRLPAAFAWIILMSLAWGAGEVTGHLVGEGRSEESWS